MILNRIRAPGGTTEFAMLSAIASDESSPELHSPSPCRLADALYMDAITHPYSRLSQLLDT